MHEWAANTMTTVVCSRCGAVAGGTAGRPPPPDILVSVRTSREAFSLRDGPFTCDELIAYRVIEL